MATLDLNQAFPLAVNGTRSPLPKQKAFFEAALDPNGAKYVAFVSGIGAGKTLIGCITVLTWAILYPSTYLVARQYMPELKVTTLTTFLEVCPKELILEHRIADGIIRVKSVGGGSSTILFRQLDEPDKLRSLNLGGVYIDEASQVSPAAFTLLQGRLRGKGLRKLILTSNPAGHDWIYQNWVKQDHFNTPEAKKQFRLIQAFTTENTHLPPEYVESLLSTYSKERIQREIYGSFDSFEGQVYSDFRRDVHVIPPFEIPKTWTRVMGHDGGFRNPAATVWLAFDGDDNAYLYRTHYVREWLIEEVCKGNKKTREPGIVALSRGETIDACYADPALKATRGQTGESDWSEYLLHIPRKFPFLPAQNDVMLGIDRVTSYLKINPKTGKPRLFVFDTCQDFLEEISTYRWKPLQSSQEGRVNQKEEPVKNNDHLLDATRYVLMSRPEGPKVSRDQDTPRDSSYYLRQELNRIKNPKPGSDPFGDA